MMTTPLGESAPTACLAQQTRSSPSMTMTSKSSSGLNDYAAIVPVLLAGLPKKDHVGRFLVVYFFVPQTIRLHSNDMVDVPRIEQGRVAAAVLKEPHIGFQPLLQKRNDAVVHIGDRRPVRPAGIARSIGAQETILDEGRPGV